MKKKKNKLIVLVGPTASGKTDVAIKLALHYNTSVISADSRQFFREIPIGTAAPSESQLQAARHYFVGHLSITDDYNVSRYEKDVINLLEREFKNNDVMILTGGSGLYIDAVCRGIDELPDPDPEIRSSLNKLYKKDGLEALQQLLQQLDPVFFNQVDRKNPKRLMRAIEVCKQTGKPYSSLRKNKPAKRNFVIQKIGLELSREELNKRIEQRTLNMIEAGWIEEARKVHPMKHMNALNTVGYTELFRYFEGLFDLELATEKIITNTRRYAKRQMTWFRKDSEIKWFNPEDIKGMIDYIERGNSSS